MSSFHTLFRTFGTFRPFAFLFTFCRILLSSHTYPVFPPRHYRAHIVCGIGPSLPIHSFNLSRWRLILSPEGV